MVIGYLGIAIKSAALIHRIEKMETPDWPNNLAFEIIGMLNKKFRPNDLLALGEHKVKILGIKLEPDQDPEELADAIAELEIEHRNDIEEDERFGTVVRACGVHKAYSATINNHIRAADKNGETRDPVKRGTTRDSSRSIEDRWEGGGLSS